MSYFDRNEPSDQEPNTQKSPNMRSHASSGDNNEDDECWDEDPLPNVEKDDMLARRTGAYQKSGGGQFYNVFFPTPGAVKQKTYLVTGMNQSCFKPSEQKSDSPLDRFGTLGNEFGCGYYFDISCWSCRVHLTFWSF